MVGGDLVPGPFPRECFDLLHSLNIPIEFIIGNGDRETLAAKRGGVSQRRAGVFSRSDGLERGADSARRRAGD